MKKSTALPMSRNRALQSSSFRSRGDGPSRLLSSRKKKNWTLHPCSIMPDTVWNPNSGIWIPQADRAARLLGMQLLMQSRYFTHSELQSLVHIYLIKLLIQHLVFQALPLVSTFWGVILFGEYRLSSRKTYLLLSAMLLMFVVAVAVLIASAGHRKAFDTNAKFIVTSLHSTSLDFRNFNISSIYYWF